MGQFLSQKCPECPIDLAGGFLANWRKNLGGNGLEPLKRFACPIFSEKSRKMGHVGTGAMVRTILGRQMMRDGARSNRPRWKSFDIAEGHFRNPAFAINMPGTGPELHACRLSRASTGFQL
ncbi:MAG TPA: hypothetical protein VFE47_15475 [Tepidisphaeraceae bacterium]|jgi:hypothetical protein|nr:hypothetical protein [Tepidisphaeraceae bacterium]